VTRLLFSATAIAVLAGPMFGGGNTSALDALAACGADQVQQLVGQSYDGVQDSFAADARIIPPNSPVTQDYRPARLNVDLDIDRAISRIWCG